MKHYIKEAAKNLNLPVEDVYNIYNYYWMFVRTKMRDCNLAESWTKEEFDEMKTSIVLPNIGKVGITWKDYFNNKKRLQYIKERNETKEN